MTILPIYLSWGAISLRILIGAFLAAACFAAGSQATEALDAWSLLAWIFGGLAWWVVCSSVWPIGIRQKPR